MDGSHSNQFNLETYRIDKGPNTVFYIPNFITEFEESNIVGNVSRAPIPRWTQLSNRRLQNWGGVPHPKGMIAEEIPQWLKKYTDRIGDLGLFDGKRPNHVLVNEYKSGQGIMPHLDGALFYPTITTINAGSHTVLNFYNPLSDATDQDADNSNKQTGWSDRLAFSMLLQPRSLLILKDDCYHHYLHGIDEICSDVVSSSLLNKEVCNVTEGQTLERDTRTSLTIRFVPKTTKPLLRIGK